ncbi:MAG: M20/M25/M40 family metallo-hydrolase [Deltaproteobacteria bacterium]|nr:M20/M25/M40 family metallo-hydrolase [Candidatus Zymogenaceae bacterium]
MEHEAVRLLSEYLKLNTTNPPGNEHKGVRFFADIFDAEGIEYKTYESLPGRGSIRAVIKGTGKKDPLTLLNHIDVVPANAEEWNFDPFSGEVTDGMIRGRGALDMKGQGILELMAFLVIKRQGITPNRDLIFVAVADEEMGGGLGMGWLLENHPEDFPKGTVINEVGFTLTDLLPSGPLAMVAPAEKGPCWLRLVRKGEPGHGSMPHDKNALHLMIEALGRLIAAERPIIITSITAEYFKNLATGWEFLKPYVEDGKEETLVEILKTSGLLSMPQMKAVVTNTLSVNKLTAGDKTNVIPSHCEAELDVRLLPGQKIDDFIAFIRKTLEDDEIEIEIIYACEASWSSMDTDDYRTMLDIIKKHNPGAVVTPWLIAGTTDSRFYRVAGADAYGILPVSIPLSHVKMIHGIDEQISVENVVTGTEIFTEIVTTLCT